MQVKRSDDAQREFDDNAALFESDLVLRNGPQPCDKLFPGKFNAAGLDRRLNELVRYLKIGRAKFRNNLANGLRPFLIHRIDRNGKRASARRQPKEQEWPPVAAAPDAAQEESGI